MKRNNPHPTARRSAFTLLELLAVITIISILLALILPAIGSVLRNARNAEVSAELSRLTTAITSFKSDHGGIEPWSAILFDEQGVWRDAGNAQRDAALRLSQTRIRRIWPQFNFSVTPRVDLNGNGTVEDVTLTGAEALVFFLAGMRRPGTDGFVGFSKNPINPFTLAGENREDPYYTFKPEQLVDIDGDGMLELIDSLPDQRTPILYVSSNNGQGYSKTNGSLNYYVQADGTTAFQKGSFQLISPGDDGEFGFDPAPNPFDSSGGSTDSRPRYSDDFDVPREQADNITNFKTGGTLGS